MSDLIACKSCGKEISKDAKICPNCGAKLKMALWKKILIGLFVLAVIGAIFGSDDQGNVASTNTQGGGSSGPTIISTDQSIASNNIKTAIADLKIQKTFSDSTGFFTAEAQPGATLVAVVVDQTNESNKPVSSFKVPDLKLISPDGIEYEQDLGKSGSYAAIMDIDQKVVSDIGPGLRSQNAFVFEVSDQLIAQPGWTLKVGNIRNILFKVN